MAAYNTDQLSQRLHNCLQTILELEEILDNTPLGPALKDEFVVLRTISSRINELCVAEDDVCRIEAATGRFLAEVKEPILLNGHNDKDPSRVLQ